MLKRLSLTDLLENDFQYGVNEDKTMEKIMWWSTWTYDKSFEPPGVAYWPSARVGPVGR